MNPNDTQATTWKTHLRDLVKAVIATAVIAAIQAIVQELSHVDWPSLFTHAAQVTVGYAAIKTRV